MVRHWWPLKELVDREAFANYDETARVYEVVTAAVFHLPGYRFRACSGLLWGTLLETATVVPGFLWDGPSGPALNDETAVVASLLHDIACTRWHHRPALPGYCRRHRLYRAVALAQNMNRARAETHFAMLLAFNWLHEVREAVCALDIEDDER